MLYCSGPLCFDRAYKIRGCLSVIPRKQLSLLTVYYEIINRHGTDSVKWDAVENRWGRNDLIPMWVADMDFRTAPFVIEALKKRLEHEVL